MEELSVHIARHGLDRLLSPELLEALLPLRRSQGELLIRSGEEVSRLFFLVEGRAKAYSTMENGHSILAAFYRPFDVLGEAEIFSADRHALNVEALTDSLCLCLPTAALRASIAKNHRLLTYLCGRMGEKLVDRAMAESINLRYPVESRLSGYLLASLDREGRVLGTDDLGEIADFIGASYRQLARVVRLFRDEGILEKTRGRIRVLDRARLAGLARDLYVHGPGKVRPENFARKVT